MNRSTIPIPAKMNKLEERYARYLELRERREEIRGYVVEGLRFRLGDGATYKPDFNVWMADGSVEIHETKGEWREAARVRIRVAADRFPMFKFFGVQWKNKEWVFEEF